MSARLAPAAAPAAGPDTAAPTPLEALLLTTLAALLAARRGSLADLAGAGGWGSVQAEFVLKAGGLATSSLTVRITQPAAERPSPGALPRRP